MRPPFWSLRFGDTLRDSTDPQSRRLFVFDNVEELRNLFEKVWEHARRYNVWVTSAQRLDTICRKYGIDDDFSVMHDPSTNDEIVAYYHAGRIHFSVDRKLVIEKLQAFDDMLHYAHRVAVPNGRAQSLTAARERQTTLDRLVGTVFGASANSVLPQHSQAVSIHDYDNFEEDHPFYVDMHGQMLRFFRQYVGKSKSAHVLEVGAGTGHFTKRVIGLVPNMKVVAVEPDGPSCEILRHRFAPKTNLIEIVECRILDFNRSQRFDCVLSSFADHHICAAEKEEYFRHLVGMLEPGGVIIVGDEFLRTYSSTRDDYSSAVTAYHSYIIDLAMKDGKWQLAELERDALRSGLADEKHRVDFKISVEEYRSLAVRAELDVLESVCVSDIEAASNIGGMYVFVLKPKA